jgi:hyperpolarization activated cyclic nucleotide-gated potassium channel 2
LSLVFFVAHWTACWWYFIGNQDMVNHPVTWVVYTKVCDKTTFDKYVAALYWAFTTMTTVGYGDIYPFTVNEKVFAMFTMILACGIFAYTVGSIGSLVSKQNSGENAYREQVVAVNRYMRKKKLPYDLQFRVRRYLEYVWENRKKNNIDEKQIISLLSEPLRDEIYAHIHGVVINNCSIFTIFEKHFISQLTKTLESETYAPGDIVIEEGEMSTKMYFIQNGKIDIYHHSTRSTINELDKNKYFGEIAFFLQTPRCASAKCIDFVDLLSLSRLNLNTLLDKFPEAKIENEKLLERCSDNDLSALNVVCYVCQKTGHVAIKCKMILLNQDHDNAKEKWLENRKEAYSHEIDTTRLDPSNYNRVPKNLLKAKPVARSVVGIQKSSDMNFPESSKIAPVVKDYLDEVSGNKNKDETKLDISLGEELPVEEVKDDKELNQKYSLIYRNSDSEGSESQSKSEDEESDEEVVVKGSGRQFRNSLLLTPISPPVRNERNSFTGFSALKQAPMMPQYNINENIVAGTPYNTIEDDGYEAECE